MASPSTQASPPASPPAFKKFSTISAFVHKSNGNTSSSAPPGTSDSSVPSVKNIFGGGGGGGGSSSTGGGATSSEMSATPRAQQQQDQGNARLTSHARGDSGPWSVSVAAADPPAPPAAFNKPPTTRRKKDAAAAAALSASQVTASTPAYTLYITTPTHNLTLQRSIADVLDLDAKIKEGLSSITALPLLPSMPTPAAASNPSPPPATGGRKILQTISRTLSPGGARNRVALGQITSSFTQSTAAASAGPTDYGRKSPTLKMPKPQRATGGNGNTVLNALGTGNASNGDTPATDEAATTKVTSGLAEYFTKLSNIPAVRKSKPFRRFVRVGSEDLQSVRVERRIHRVRSDLAKHVKHSVAPRNTNVGVGPSQSDIGEDGTRTDDERDAASLSARSASRQSNSLRPGSAHSDAPGSPAQVVPPRSTSTDTNATAQQQGSSSPLIGSPTPAAGKRSSPNFAGIPEEADKEKEAGNSTGHTMADDSILTAAATSITTAVAATTDTSLDSSAIENATPAKRRGTGERRKKRRDADKVTVDDFEMIRVLGKGCAGKVLLVKHRPTTSLFAMKAIHKKHVLAHQELQHTLTEQAVLKRMAREVHDPFVVKLWWSFHDKNNLYLVMDFHPGGDLATQLSRWGRLGRDRARFYAAEIVEGVEGLHKAGVVYRDLKPENVLIGSDGHIVLSDFGLSKEFPSRAERAGGASTPPPGSPQRANSITDGGVGGAGTITGGRPHWMSASEDNSAGRSVDDGDATTRRGGRWGPGDQQADMTSTFCGTAEYLAPEVIQGSAYSYEVDWWSFGTMLYEMLTGITPFWADTHADMYVRVLHDELIFPDDRVLDHDTKSILRGLLQRSPQLRMKEPRIKRHPYFSMIEWAHVFHKRYIPPYIPPIDPLNAMDTQNFDETFLDMQPVVNGDEDEDEEGGGAGGDEAEQKASQAKTTKTATPAAATTATTDKKSTQDSAKDAAKDKKASAPSIPADGKSLFDGYSFRGRKDSGSIRSSIRSDSLSVALSGSTSQAVGSAAPEAEDTDVPSTPVKRSAPAPATPTPTTTTQPTAAAAIINAHNAKQAAQKASAAAKETESSTTPNKTVPSATMTSTSAPAAALQAPGPLPVQAAAHATTPAAVPAPAAASAAPPAPAPVVSRPPPPPPFIDNAEDSEDDETAARNALRALAALEREASGETTSQTSASVSTHPTSIGLSGDEKASSDRGASTSDEAGAGPISGLPATGGSGLLAATRGRTSGLPTQETIAETDDEEEDWDVIDAPSNGGLVPSEANGGRGQNLFSRGVVDTYRLLRRQDSTRVGGGSSSPGGLATPPRPFSRLSRRHRNNHLHRPSRGDLTSGSAASLESASATTSSANVNILGSRSVMTPSASANVARDGINNNNASTVTFDEGEGGGGGAGARGSLSLAAPITSVPAAGRMSGSGTSSEDVHRQGSIAAAAAPTGDTLAVPSSNSGGAIGTGAGNPSDKRQSRIKRRFTTFFEQAGK